MSMDSVDQEPTWDTARMACVHSTMSRPSGRLEAGAEIIWRLLCFKLFLILFYIFISLVAPLSLQDLRSLTRD